jgi:hypothetical protein
VHPTYVALEFRSRDEWGGTGVAWNVVGDGRTDPNFVILLLLSLSLPLCMCRLGWTDIVRDYFSDAMGCWWDFCLLLIIDLRGRWLTPPVAAPRSEIMGSTIRRIHSSVP